MACFLVYFQPKKKLGRGKVIDKLIEALQIFLKYGNPEWPTHCEHDVLTVDIRPELVSDEDIEKLNELGFHVNEDDDDFQSYKFGSC